MVTDGIIRTLLIWPEMVTPFFNQRYVNGPVPDGVVLNWAGLPTLMVWLISGVTLGGARTVRRAQLVTLVQPPVTRTQYVPASAAWTEAME